VSPAGKLALVTGAASGIGRATACALARAGADLVVCDVDRDGLEQTAASIRSLGRSVLARRVDVSRRDEMADFATAVHAAHGTVDILVNNAGVGLGGGLLDTSLEDWDWIVPINMWGVIYGCHFFVPAMVARGQGGHVVNVSSVAGFLAAAPLLAYSTTKFAVFGLSEALRDELVPHRIGVTAVCPGIINTPITRSSRMRGRLATTAAREALVTRYQQRNYGPERVADAILKAIRQNRAVLPVSPEAWVIYFLKRLVPGLTARLNRRIWTALERSIAGPAPEAS
jgi:NAD(P)-dependent dehydrogenase (short-subunit alcohol dehydrogenase family)